MICTLDNYIIANQRDTESKRIKSGKWYFNTETNEIIVQSDKTEMEILSREKNITLKKIKTRTYDSK